MLYSLALSVFTASFFISGTIGHAGGHSEEEIRSEILLRKAVTANAKRAVDGCGNSPAADALKHRALARRMAAAHAIRVKRGLSSGMSMLTLPRNPCTNHICQTEHVRARRDTDSLQRWAAFSHDKTESETYTLDTPTSALFASNATCALVPEPSSVPITSKAS